MRSRGCDVYEGANETNKGIFEASLDICLILKYVKERSNKDCLRTTVKYFKISDILIEVLAKKITH